MEKDTVLKGVISTSIAVTLMCGAWAARARAVARETSSAPGMWLFAEGRVGGEPTRGELPGLLRDGIDGATQLAPSERAIMHANLDAALRLGLSEAELSAMFPLRGRHRELSGQTMLRLQNRILAMAGEGLPVDIMLAKINEGRIKAVPEPLLERACDRLESYVRSAQRLMGRARDAGLELPDNPVSERRVEREIAQQMWRGMSEDSYGHLLEVARTGVHGRHHSLEDVVSAAGLAARLQEQGAGKTRALQVSGEALRRGYRGGEMQRFQLMVMSRDLSGAVDGFLGDLEHCLSEDMDPDEMYRYMMQHGWMGAGDMWGPGGYNPVDDMGHGPGHDGSGGHHGGGGHHGDEDGHHGGGGHGGGHGH